MPKDQENTLVKTDRRKRRTRRQLLESAIQLVLEKGYEEVRTEEITELADIGRRTFYNHFISKRECVLAAIINRYCEHADRMVQALDEEQGADHAMTLATMAAQMFRLIAMDPVTEKLISHPRILSEAVAESQRDYIVANVAQGMVAGVFKPLIPVESLEPMVAWGFVGLVVTSIPRKSQQQDSLVWAQFILHNLGIGEAETNELLSALEV